MIFTICASMCVSDGRRVCMIFVPECRNCEGHTLHAPLEASLSVCSFLLAFGHKQYLTVSGRNAQEPKPAGGAAPQLTANARPS